MARETHSAIPSWSGYIYQGKIAIYEALRVIRKQLSIDVNFDFSDYMLEVEWQEDFSIKIGQKYKSIHQVKAYNDGTSPTKYNQALKDLFEKIDNKVADIGFLNIWKPIGFTQNTESKNFSELKTANKGNYDQDILEKVKIYKYHTDSETCGLDEIDELIIEKIEKIYRLKDFGIDAGTNSQYKYVQFKLYQLLDVHILEIHSGTRSKDDTISFEDILDKFNKNYEEYSKEYEHIKVKNALLYQISRYCDDPELCSNAEWRSEEDCQGCILFDAEQILEKMSAEDVFKVVYNATPDYRIFEDLIRENGLKFSLIKILHNLNPACRTDHFHFKSSEYSIPSSLIDVNNKKEIAKRILENKSLDLLVNLFEIDMYISNDIEILDIEEEAKKVRSIDEAALEGIYQRREDNSICKIKNLKIKPLDSVKEEINNAH